MDIIKFKYHPWKTIKYSIGDHWYRHAEDAFKAPTSSLCPKIKMLHFPMFYFFEAQTLVIETASTYQTHCDCNSVIVMLTHTHLLNGMSYTTKINFTMANSRFSINTITKRQRVWSCEEVSGWRLHRARMSNNERKKERLNEKQRQHTTHNMCGWCSH